jgi:hypothetical protein
MRDEATRNVAGWISREMQSLTKFGSSTANPNDVCHLSTKISPFSVSQNEFPQHIRVQMGTAHEIGRIVSLSPIRPVLHSKRVHDIREVCERLKTINLCTTTRKYYGRRLICDWYLLGLILRNSLPERHTFCTAPLLTTAKSLKKKR